MDKTRLTTTTNIFEWLVIDLGHQIKGEFHYTDEEIPYLEGEFSNLKWSEGLSFGHHAMRALIVAFELHDGALSLRLRIACGNHNEVLASIVLLGNEVCPDVERLLTLMNEFIQCVTAQQPIDFRGMPAIKSRAVCTEVQSEAQMFLQSKGGKKVQSQLRVIVGDEEFGAIHGKWNPKPNVDEKAVSEKTIVGYYDGRRFRARMMAVVEAGGHSAEHSIFYDEDRFDEKLRTLNDDKMTILEVRVRVESSDRDVRMDLLEMRVVKLPSELELVG